MKWWMYLYGSQTPKRSQAISNSRAIGAFDRGPLRNGLSGKGGSQDCADLRGWTQSEEVGWHPGPSSYGVSQPHLNMCVCQKGTLFSAAT